MGAAAVHEDDTYEQTGEHESLAVAPDAVEVRRSAAVAAGIDQLPEKPARVIACGGGRHNPALMAALRGALPCKLMSAEEAGWRGDSIEAEAFAYLAARRMRELPLSWPMTTGAMKAP